MQIQLKCSKYPVERLIERQLRFVIYHRIEMCSHKLKVEKCRLAYLTPRHIGKALVNQEGNYPLKRKKDDYLTFPPDRISSTPKKVEYRMTSQQET